MTHDRPINRLEEWWKRSQVEMRVVWMKVDWMTLDFVSILLVWLIVGCFAVRDRSSVTKGTVIWTEDDSTGTTRLVSITGDPHTWIRTRTATTHTLFPPSTPSPFPPSSTLNISALAFDYDEGILFWSESTARGIMELRLNGNPKLLPVLMDGGRSMSAEVRGLAFDWIGRNILWTDSEYGWIKMMGVRFLGRPEGAFTSLVLSGLPRPVGIAIYPSKGLLMWSDWGDAPRIERASLSGQDRRVLVETGLDRPIGLAIDYRNDRVFWVDHNLGEVGSIGLDGQNRRLHVRMTGAQFYGIALYESVMFVTEMTSRQLFVFNTNSSQLDVNFDVGSGTPRDVIIFDENPQENFLCRSAGCDHLCVTNHFRSIVCLCATGFRLQPDGRTCSDAINSSVFLFTDATWRMLHSLDRNEGQFRSHSLPTEVTPFALDYDPFHRTFYFFDARSKVIQSSNLSGSDVRDLISLPQVSFPVGFALDPVSRLLFYTDSGRHTIGVVTLDEGHHVTLFPNDLDNPSLIAVDHLKGLVFWTELGDRGGSGIHVSFMDGAGRRLAVPIRWKRPGGSPTSLTVDAQEQRIFWVEGHGTSIDVSDYQGRDRDVISPTGSGQILGLSALIDGRLLYFDRTKRSVIRVEKSKPDYSAVTFDLASFSIDPTYFRAYSAGKESEPSKGALRNGCSHRNGGCRQFVCLPIPDGRHCRCPDTQTFNRTRDCLASSSVIVTSSEMARNDVKQREVKATEVSRGHQTNWIDATTWNEDLPTAWEVITTRQSSAQLTSSYTSVEPLEFTSDVKGHSATSTLNPTPISAEGQTNTRQSWSVSASSAGDLEMNSEATHPPESSTPHTGSDGKNMVKDIGEPVQQTKETSNKTNNMDTNNSRSNNNDSNNNSSNNDNSNINNRSSGNYLGLPFGSDLFSVLQLVGIVVSVLLFLVLSIAFGFFLRYKICRRRIRLGVDQTPNKTSVPDPTKEIFNSDLFVDPADDLYHVTGTTSIGRRSAPLAERFHISSLAEEEDDDEDNSVGQKTPPQTHPNFQRNPRMPNKNPSWLPPSLTTPRAGLVEVRNMWQEKEATFSTFLEGPKMAAVDSVIPCARPIEGHAATSRVFGSKMQRRSSIRRQKQQHIVIDTNNMAPGRHFCNAHRQSTC